MKRCPTCDRLETDEALKFCRVDGATLVSDSGAMSSDAGTVKLAHVYARLGRRSEFDAIIKELEKRYTGKSADGRDLAVAYAGANDKEHAFAWLEKAFADHSVFLAFLKLEPLLEGSGTPSRCK